MERRLAFLPALVLALVLAGGCDGGPAEPTGSGGDGGEGGGGPAPSVEGAPECGPFEAKLGGAPAGQDLTATFAPTGVALSGGVQIELPSYGGLYLQTVGGDDLGVVHAASGLLRLPEDSAEPGAWYCGGEGSAVLLDEDLSVSMVVLRSVSSLGACPGEAVLGGMEVCFPGNMGCTSSLVSTVAGAPFEAPLEGFGQASGLLGDTEARFAATITGSGGFITLQAKAIDPMSTGVQTSELGIGFVTIPEGQPDSGAVYCVGAGSTIDYQMEGPFAMPLSAKLQNLSRLPPCPGTPVDGEVGFCMNLNR